MTEYTFKFYVGKGGFVDFTCNSDMPALLYDELRKVVTNFYKEEEK